MVLKDLEFIYSFLYDLFNQRFNLTNTEFGLCSVTNEEYSDVFKVHREFRCILIKKETDLFVKPEEVEATLPSPLVNRFEKHILNLQNIQKTGKFFHDEIRVNFENIGKIGDGF